VVLYTYLDGQLDTAIFKTDGELQYEHEFLYGSDGLPQSSTITNPNDRPQLLISYRFDDTTVTREYKKTGFPDVLHERLTFRMADEPFQVGFYDPYSYVDTGRFFERGMILEDRSYTLNGNPAPDGAKLKAELLSEGTR
jgi:hypothetical protein